MIYSVKVNFRTNPLATDGDKENMMLDLDVNEDGVTATGVMSKYTFLCKLHNDEWVMHAEDRPAIIYPETAWFFYNGINYVIEDIPHLDEESKLILKLKYTQRSNYNHGYAAYTP